MTASAVKKYPLAITRRARERRIENWANSRTAVKHAQYKSSCGLRRICASCVELTAGRDQFLFGRVSMPYDRAAGSSHIGGHFDGTAHRGDHQCNLDSRIGSLES